MSKLFPKMPKIQGCFDLKKPHVFYAGENAQKMLGQWLGLNTSSPEFSEPALPRQSILGLGRLGREADLRVTGTNLLFGFFENLSQNSILY